MYIPLQPVRSCKSALTTETLNPPSSYKLTVLSGSKNHDKGLPGFGTGLLREKGKGDCSTWFKLLKFNHFPLGKPLWLYFSLNAVSSFYTSIAKYFKNFMITCLRKYLFLPHERICCVNGSYPHLAQFPALHRI